MPSMSEMPSGSKSSRPVPVATSQVSNSFQSRSRTFVVASTCLWGDRSQLDERGSCSWLRVGCEGWNAKCGWESRTKAGLTCSEVALSPERDRGTISWRRVWQCRARRLQRAPRCGQVLRYRPEEPAFSVGGRKLKFHGC